MPISCSYFFANIRRAMVTSQHRRCLNVGSDGSSIYRVSRPQAKATKSKREEPESAGALREFIEGAGPTDKVEQGGVVIRSILNLL